MTSSSPLPPPLPASVKVMKHPLFVCLCGDIVALGLVTTPPPPHPGFPPHPSTPTPGTSVPSSTSAGDKNKLALSKFHERMSLRNTKAFFRLYAARSVINWSCFTRRLQVPGFQLSCGKKTHERVFTWFIATLARVIIFRLPPILFLFLLFRLFLRCICI